MKTFSSFLIAWLFAAGSLLGEGTPSDTVSSPVVGFQEFDCLGGSDTVIAIPFERAATFRGLIHEVSAPSNSDRTRTLTLAGGAPGWSDDELAGSHFLRINSGNAAGRQFPVKSHSGAEVEIEVPAGHPPLPVESGDGIDLIPFWTPASLFPADTQSTLHASSSLLPSQRGSELFFYPSGPTLENISPERVFFVTDSGWFESTEGVPAADDVAIPPHAVLVIRHPEGADDTVFRPASLVTAVPSAVVLESKRGVRLDHYVSLSRPLPSTIEQLDFLPREFAPSPGLAPSQRRDLLLIFDNSEAEQNRQPSDRYFFHRGDWYRVGGEGEGPTVANDDSLSPGAALVIRKAATLNHQATVWTQDPNL